ncbi:MAG: ABC transporter permease [Gemmatimonadaceae bacterium]|jgi:simple sugar transport system permease protein|nr:ABC transporter permease [Gemmatimonadaceae bacterium]
MTPARRAGIACVAAIGGVGALALLLAVFGYSPADGLLAFWRGSVGTSYALWSATLVRAIPLSLAGLGVALAIRGGRLNVGAEGQLLAGATAGALVAQLLGAVEGGTATGGGMSAALTTPIVLIAGALAGAAWASVAAWLRERFGVLEVISTIMLNFIAVHLVGALVRGVLQEPTRVYPQSATLAAAARLPVLVPTTRLHAGALLAITLAALLWWTLRYTALGFRVRVVGESAAAAASAGGIDVARVAVMSFAVSGALAGLAGAVEYAGVTYALYENLSPGYGYTAIAVALLARLNPLWVIASGVLFGALQAGGAAMQRDAGVPATLVQMIEAILIIAIVLVDRASRRRAAEAGT